MQPGFRRGGGIKCLFSDWDKACVAQTFDVAAVSYPAARKVIIWLCMLDSPSEPL